MKAAMETARKRVDRPMLWCQPAISLVASKAAKQADTMESARKSSEAALHTRERATSAGAPSQRTRSDGSKGHSIFSLTLPSS